MRIQIINSGKLVTIFKNAAEEYNKHLSGLPVASVQNVYLHKTSLQRNYDTFHRVGLLSDIVSSSHYTAF